jgi:hypothetical protein
MTETTVDSGRLIGAAYPLLTTVKLLKMALQRFGRVELVGEKPWAKHGVAAGSPIWRAMQGAADRMIEEVDKPPRGKECGFRVHLDATYLLGTADLIKQMVPTGNTSISGEVRNSLFAWRVEHDLRMGVLSAASDHGWNPEIEIAYVDAGYFDDDAIALVCVRVAKKPAT